MKISPSSVVTHLQSKSTSQDKNKRHTFWEVDSPIRLFVIVTGTLFFVEFFLMAVLFSHTFQKNLAEILLDPTLMVVISFPVLYGFFLAPMKRLLAERARAEQKMANMNEVLEMRVQERTQELNVTNVQLQEKILEHQHLQDELEIRVQQRTRELMDEIQERVQIEHELEQTNNILTSSSAAEREQRKVAEGLVEAAIALSNSQSVEEVLDRILDETQRVLPFAVITLMLIDQGHPIHVGWRGLERIKSLASGMDHEFHITDYPVLELLTTGYRPLLVTDTSTYPGWLPVVGLEWIRSFASAPLGLDGKVIGYLQIICEQPDQINERSLQILIGFAAHAGVAIQNARLIENLQQSLNKELAIREELIRTEKLAAMGRTIASVAHELNNPVQTIKNCTFLLRSTIKGTDIEVNGKELLDMVSSETQRITALVSQLREFFRPSTSVFMLPVNLNDLIHEVNASLKAPMRAAKVLSKIEAGDLPVVVFAAPDQMRQIFINLFQNAIDAMENGGRLEVKFTVCVDKKRLGISVMDTGPGIAEAVQTRVFEPFFSTKPKGMGLGLPIVSQIIQRHGGTIRIESTPGKGTTFMIELPLYVEVAEENDI